MKTTSLNGLAWLEISLIVLAFNARAQAQDEDEKQVAPDGVALAKNSDVERRRSRIEEVVVTATKRQENVQDIPVSIAVIGNEDLERRSLVGMEDYLRSIPGVNQIDRGGTDNSIIVRGIATSPEFEGLKATVATYFDETPITGAAARAGGIDVRPVDIERIEVLRGPQGTAYGSASLGGAMRIIPVRPNLDSFGGKLLASFSDTSGEGSENSMVQGILNVPLAANSFAVRLVGYRYDESGYYHNSAGLHPPTIALFDTYGVGDQVRGYVQDDIGRMRTTGGRASASWQVTDKLNLSANFLTQEIEQDGFPVATIGRYEQARPPVIDPKARVRGERGEVNDTDMDLINVVLNYDLSWASLTSTASWIESGAMELKSFGVVLPLFVSTSSAETSFDSFSTETRLVSQFSGRFQFLGGVFYEDIKTSSHNITDWPDEAVNNPWGSDPGFVFRSTGGYKQRAVFGEVSYELVKGLTATVGGRYFDYETPSSSVLEGGLLGRNPDGTLRVPLGAGVPTVLKSDDSDTSLKASINYKPAPDTLLYASWAEGFRLGGPSSGVSPRCDADFDGLIDGTRVTVESTKTINSDFLESFEIGGKAAFFDRRMTVDAAVYYNEWEGLPILVTPPCLSPYTANAGSATSKGLELQASLLVLEGLRVNFGGGYTNAEIAKDQPVQGWREGDRLPGSPQVTLNFGAQYDFNIAGYRMFVRADSFYTGEFYSDLRETPGLEAGDYTKVDASVGAEIARFNVELFARNLTNEDAFTWRGIHQAAGGTNPYFGYRLRPRTVGIEIGYSFK